MSKTYKQIARFGEFANAGDMKQYVQDFFTYDDEIGNHLRTFDYLNLINSALTKKYGDDVYADHQAFYGNVDANLGDAHEVISEIIADIDMQDLA